MEDSRRPFIDIHLFGAKGRGVRAREAIAAGQLIESCPVLILSADDLARLQQTRLADYTFAWPDSDGDAVAFGYLSFVNHAEDPNSRVDRDPAAQVIRWYALRAIEAGEEITFRYRDTSWFQVL